VIDISTLDPPPAGFPGCQACPCLLTGTAQICFSCASTGAEPGGGPTCAVCGKELAERAPCDNSVCLLDDPEFSDLHTVLLRAEDVWTALTRYKYDEDRSWAEVLGRIVTGYLDEHEAAMRRYDVITTGALYVGPRANRLWDHLRLILEAAQAHGPSWPFAYDVIAKSGPTGQFLGRSAGTRRKIAEHSLRAALSIPDPARVAGKRVLVLDDVYSEGYSMREMARCLREAGAAEVAGLVLARKKGG
jgi:predicted amidophosphoribosyltransferase